MGALIELLHKIQQMDDVALFERFEHITRAQAIREYMDAKKDVCLDSEVRLAREEILKRMTVRESHGIKIIKN